MPAPEKFSILLIDDDPMVVRIMGRMLSDFTPLRFATSGRVALQLARESVPDLVLLDVDMPEFSGLDVCAAFKREPALANVPIIFMTSHESSQLEARGLQLGAADFIHKPPHAPLILARVRTYQRLKTLSDTMRGAVNMDFLSGAVTRRHLEKVLTQEWLRSQRSTAPIALLVADIEGFAAYNAACGEDLGDECLKAVADALRSAAHRSTDLLGRFAGGKFALLLPETDPDGAVIVAQRAIDAVDKLRLASGEPEGGFVRLSIGGACADTAPGAPVRPVDGAPDELISYAERALAEALSEGGHRAKYRLLARRDAAEQPPIAAAAAR